MLLIFLSGSFFSSPVSLALQIYLKLLFIHCALLLKLNWHATPNVNVLTSAGSNSDSNVT